MLERSWAACASVVAACAVPANSKAAPANNKICLGMIHLNSAVDIDACSVAQRKAGRIGRPG
jgi:hypothetical protein